eukprot:5372070-Pleurochrysis_carterae.AAC.1
MLCAHVWFPVVSSNARAFCSKEHLLAYNADDDKVSSPVPVRRRQDEPDEITPKVSSDASIVGNAAAASETGLKIGESGTGQAGTAIGSAAGSVAQSNTGDESADGKRTEGGEGA